MSRHMEVRWPVQIIPAQPGWQALVHLHSGFGALVDGEYQLYTEMATKGIDPATIPTDRLGGIRPVIAWALIQTWEEDLEDGYEPIGRPPPTDADDHASEFARWVYPVIVANRIDIEITDEGIVRLIPPEEKISEAQIRAELLEDIRSCGQAEHGGPARTPVAAVSAVTGRAPQQDAADPSEGT